jgi:pimeloyl-ACP methyl ester carboxylesterase
MRPDAYLGTSMLGRLVIRLIVGCAVLAGAGAAAASRAATADSDLPRRAGAREESYPGVLVRYDSLRDAAGHRLRLIVTHPKTGGPRFPTVFVVGWLSCDSVEAPPGTRDATQLTMQAVIRMPGFATVRLDKPGVGDSEGDCASTDFVTELAAYRLALKMTRESSFADPDRIFLFGMSNGGGFAPLVAETTPVRGYVVVGGWIKTWFEHMLEIERRRLALEGHSASEINSLMKRVCELYSRYLIDKQSPRQILAQHREMASLWEEDADHQYGRPIAFYQQLQDLDLMAAWSHVSAPTLAMHGEFDWIMSREDIEIIASLVNNNSPGSAEFVELKQAGHTFEHYLSMQAAYAGQRQPFDTAVADKVTGWFERHR